jgi:hypothetical protein
MKRVIIGTISLCFIIAGCCSVLYAGNSLNTNLDKKIPRKRNPVYDLSVKIRQSFSVCTVDSNNNQAVEKFVYLLEKSMIRKLYKYDQQGNNNKFEKPVHAWWLMDTEEVEKWFDFLSKANNIHARRLLGSQKFRDTLDGEIAEVYYNLSLNVEKSLRKRK